MNTTMNLVTSIIDKIYNLSFHINRGNYSYAWIMMRFNGEATYNEWIEKRIAHHMDNINDWLSEIDTLKQDEGFDYEIGKLNGDIKTAEDMIEGLATCKKILQAIEYLPCKAELGNDKWEMVLIYDEIPQQILAMFGYDDIKQLINTLEYIDTEYR